MGKAYGKAEGVFPARSRRACHCIGPQGDDPVCPCRMQNVKIVEGCYVEVIKFSENEDMWRVLGRAPKSVSGLT